MIPIWLHLSSLAALAVGLTNAVVGSTRGNPQSNCRPHNTPPSKPIDFLQKAKTMTRNTLYLAIGALIVIVVGLAVYVYRQETKPSGIEIQLNEDGVSVDEN